MNVWWRVREEGRVNECLVESEIRGRGGGVNICWREREGVNVW